MGNNSLAPVLGRGRGTAIFSLNGQRVLVRNVLHVPVLSKPVYSLRAHLEQRGCGFIGTSESGIVFFPRLSCRSTLLRIAIWCIVLLVRQRRSLRFTTFSLDASPTFIHPRHLIPPNLSTLSKMTPPVLAHQWHATSRPSLPSLPRIASFLPHSGLPLTLQDWFNYPRRHLLPRTLPVSPSNSIP